jgi:serine/threonine protein kinase
MPVHLSKPTKLFTVRDAQSIVLSDFGKAFRPEHPNRWPCLGRDSGVPLNARAPEALFEPELPISFASDIWSLACAIWHLLGSSAGLFSTVEVRTDSMVADVLGALDGLDDLPRAWRRQWDRPDDLAHEIHSPVQTPMSSSPPLPKRPHDIDEHPPPTLRSLFELHVQQPRRQLGNPFEDDEVEAILALFRGMLKLDPKERWTIQQVLESEWMRKWTLPVLNTRVKSERGTFQKNYPTCERKNFEGKGLSSC